MLVLHFHLATIRLPFHYSNWSGCGASKNVLSGMHFMNPVPIMKLVEIIRGCNTSAEVTKPS
jgi:3-hydroxyacyl-CoA dehydrogenase